MNEKLFYLIYGASEKNKIICSIAIIVTKLSYYLFFAAFALGAVYTILKIPQYAARYVIVSASGLILNTALRKIFRKPRPFVRLGTKNRIKHKNSYSFPSNHSACAMVITMAAISLNKTGFLLIPAVIITGLSRIAAGVHYPADVAAGWLIGFAVGYIGYFSGLI